MSDTGRNNLSATLTPAALDDARAQFERDGFIVIRDALTADETARYRDALDRVYLAAEQAGRIKPGGPLHQLSAVAHCA